MVQIGIVNLICAIVWLFKGKQPPWGGCATGWVLLPDLVPMSRERVRNCLSWKQGRTLLKRPAVCIPLELVCISLNWPKMLLSVVSIVTFFSRRAPLRQINVPRLQQKELILDPIRKTQTSSLIMRWKVQIQITMTLTDSQTGKLRLVHNRSIT